MSEGNHPKIEFHQTVDPTQPDKWFNLTLRCPACSTDASILHVTGKEAQRWINLFTMFHERANCGFDPHRPRITPR